MRLIYLFLVLPLFSIAASQNISNVFAPYIAASASYRHSKISTAISVTAFRPRFIPASNSSPLSEEEARRRMLARPHGSTPAKRKQNPYAKGHTHRPTVNLHKPSHVDVNASQIEPTLQQNLLNSTFSASANASRQRTIAHRLNHTEKSEIPFGTVHKLSASTLQLNRTDKHFPDNKASVSKITLHTADVPAHGSAFHGPAASEFETQVVNSVFDISLVLPLTIFPPVIWLVVKVARRHAICGANSQHKARILRKRLISPRDMHV